MPATAPYPSGNGSANSVPLVVGPGTGRGRSFNRPRISIVVCSPVDGGNCQRIDDMLVDTGSTGVRINKAALRPALLEGLPHVGNALGPHTSECERFATTLVWGAIKSADITIGGMQARSVPVHVLEADGVVPDECSNHGAISRMDVDADNSNGILGLSMLADDRGMYYGCAVAECTPSSIAAASITGVMRQVVSMFGNDANGLVIELPRVPEGRAWSVTGRLIFGIGTQANNQLGDAAVFAADQWGYIASSVVDGNDMGPSLLDSGLSYHWFSPVQSQKLPLCDNGFYFCPAETVVASAVITDDSGRRRPTAFSVANAMTQFSAPSLGMYGDIAARRTLPAGSKAYMYYGLPFFFGRRVFVGLAGSSAIDSRGATIHGPFNAFAELAAEPAY